MKRTIATACIAITGVAGIVAGCGDSAPAETADTASVASNTAAAGTTGTTASTDATATISTAFSALRAQSHIATSASTQKIDVSGLPADMRDEIQDQVDKTSGSVTSTTRYESPDRLAITQEIQGRTQQIVLYDGSAYVSANGTDWARATGEAAAAFNQASSLARIDSATLFTNITAAGTTSVEGAPAQKFTADINTAAAGDTVQSVIGGLGALGSALGDAVKIDEGSAEILVDDATGAVSQMTITMDISLDLGALAASAGEDIGESATFRVASTATETVTDFGGDVTVDQPTASTTVSSITELGEFLAS